MRTVEELTTELDELTKEAIDKAKELRESLIKYNNIDLGETTEEDAENIRGFQTAANMRRRDVLRMLLVEWGGLLFM